jgi:hypothetical protein
VSARQLAAARWALGVAGAAIMLLATLGANAQLRRFDALEARVLAVERVAERCPER